MSNVVVKVEDPDPAAGLGVRMNPNATGPAPPVTPWHLFANHPSSSSYAPLPPPPPPLYVPLPPPSLPGQGLGGHYRYPSPPLHFNYAPRPPPVPYGYAHGGPMPIPPFPVLLPVARRSVDVSDFNVNAPMPLRPHSAVPRSEFRPPSSVARQPTLQLPNWIPGSTAMPTSPSGQNSVHSEPNSRRPVPAPSTLNPPSLDFPHAMRMAMQASPAKQLLLSSLPDRDQANSRPRPNLHSWHPEGNPVPPPESRVVEPPTRRPIPKVPVHAPPIVSNIQLQNERNELDLLPPTRSTGTKRKFNIELEEVASSSSCTAIMSPDAASSEDPDQPQKVVRWVMYREEYFEQSLD